MTRTNTGTKDMAGQKCGRLFVIARAGSLNRNATWRCICECGQECIRLGSAIRSGNTKSCGCLHAETVRKKRPAPWSETHGLSNTPEYKCWEDMKKRCNNPNAKNYKNYGERGIKVCKKWKAFEGFFGDMGLRPTNRHTIERIDVNKGYCKENCKWATSREQARNKRTTVLITHEGKTMCAKDWSNHFGMSYPTFLSRYNRGISLSNMRPEDLRKNKNSVLITHEGKTMCAKDWSDYFKVNYKAFLSRYHRGRSVNEILEALNSDG